MTLIIAHRGASGYLPEHTAPAKAYAYALGADFIEQDVIATRDHELVVLHDPQLDAISNVAEVFPERRREDGYHYVVDFTLAELSELTLHERRKEGSDELLYPGRFPYREAGFKVQTLEQEIRLISGLNATTGRHVGIYPEIKDPVLHESAGIDLTLLFHEAIEQARPMISGPVFVQSFSERSLRRMRDELGGPWPLIRLLETRQADALATGEDSVERIAEYAAGVGLPVGNLLLVEEGSLRPSPLAGLLADSGLEIHPYRLRREITPPGGVDYREVLRFLIEELKVDALFIDHPDDALRIRGDRGV